MTFRIRSATKEDTAAWVRMRRRTLAGARRLPRTATEIAKYFAGLLRMPLEVLIAVDD